MAATISTRRTILHRAVLPAMLGLCGLMALGVGASRLGHEPSGAELPAGSREVSDSPLGAARSTPAAEDRPEALGPADREPPARVEPPTAAMIDAAVAAAERRDLRAMERGTRTMTPGSFTYSHAQTAAPTSAAGQGV